MLCDWSVTKSCEVYLFFVCVAVVMELGDLWACNRTEVETRISMCQQVQEWNPADASTCKVIITLEQGYLRNGSLRGSLCFTLMNRKYADGFCGFLHERRTNTHTHTHVQMNAAYSYSQTTPQSN